MLVAFIFILLALYPFQDDPCSPQSWRTASIEAFSVRSSKEAYYRALRLTQVTLKTDNPQFGALLLYFLHLLRKQIEQFEFKIEQEQTMLISLPKLAIDIVRLVEQKGRITMADILQHTGAPRSTIKKQLNYLIEQNYLARHGQGKGVWYTKKLNGLLK